jgi:hypothetical protein
MPKYKEKAERIGYVSRLREAGFSTEELSSLSTAEMRLMYLAVEVNELAERYRRSENGLKDDILKKFQKRHNEYMNHRDLLEKTIGPDEAQSIFKKYQLNDSLE